ncbi:MAG: diguanylate cyclase [Planctomycetaceae bacterium]|jgi:diguanylate cyclase (GGDEF)-like protein|nr:diguanylate cyclase [Planctomycetaceae bacterium]
MRSTEENSISDVLIVDDDPAIVSLLSHLLEQSRHKIRTASDGNQALQMVLQECPDVLITDSIMPCLDGLELTRRVRQLHARKVLPHYSYILLMTNQSNRSLLVEGLESGVDDFIEKSVSSLSDLRMELQARMNAARRIRQLETSLEFAAKYDFLTALLNRISFFSGAVSMWDRAGKNKSPISCVMLDCDFFKRINDIYGHSAGDLVLKEIADAMRNYSRSTDLLCRYGGEEFVALLPGCSEQMAFEWADRLRQQFEDNPIRRRNFEVPITISFGVAERSDSAESLEQLIDRADAALLQAKERGRNRVIRYSESIAEEGNPLPSGNLICRICSGVDAGEVAVPFPVSVSESDTALMVLDAMLKTQCDTLPVFSEADVFLGTISLRNILAILGNKVYMNRPILGLVAPNAVSYPADTPIQTIFNFFVRTSVQHILIMNKQVLVGSISRLSLTHWLRFRMVSASDVPDDTLFAEAEQADGLSFTAT